MKKWFLFLLNIFTISIFLNNKYIKTVLPASPKRIISPRPTNNYKCNDGFDTGKSCNYYLEADLLDMNCNANGHKGLNYGSCPTYKCNDGFDTKTSCLDTDIYYGDLDNFCNQKGHKGLNNSSCQV